MMRPLLALVGMIVILGCSSDAAVEVPRAGLATVFDSSRADSLVARTAGTVPDSMLRGVVEELRIQPSADDTSSFTETFEFEVGADGRVYVFDSPSARLFVFGTDGTQQRVVGRKGAGPGEFSGDNGMVMLRDGRLALLDAQNARLNFFSATGDFLSSWIVPAGFSTNEGVRTDTTGSLYLVRPVTAPREGEILGRMGLVRLADGGKWLDSLVAPDLPVERIVYVARKDGNMSATGPTHAARFLWGWHRDGYFVSSSAAKYEIEVSRPGRGLRIVRDAAPVPVPAAERAWDQERITQSLRRSVPDWVWTGPDIPAVKPPIRALHLTRDGRIWVRVSTPSEAIPDAEREPARPGRSLPPSFRDAHEYEVFAATGQFLGRVRFPESASLMDADGDLLWVLVRDADGLPGVARWRVSPGF